MRFTLLAHNLELDMNIDHYQGHRAHYNYRLNINGQTIFKGNDFSSGMPDEIKDLVSLLGFLTLRKGDIESDYFKDYTPDQFEFSESEVADEIRMLCYDYEYSQSIDENSDDYEAVMESIETLENAIGV